MTADQPQERETLALLREHRLESIERSDSLDPGISWDYYAVCSCGEWSPTSGDNDPSGWEGHVAALAALPRPAPVDGAFERAIADASTKVALDQGLADLAAGRVRRWVAPVDGELARLREAAWLDDIIRCLDIGLSHWQDDHRMPGRTGAWQFVGGDGSFHAVVQSTVRRLKDYRAAATPDAATPDAAPGGEPSRPREGERAGSLTPAERKGRGRGWRAGLGRKCV